LSPALTRIFKIELGMTPGVYIESARVEAARNQLESTDATLDRIASTLGSAPPTPSSGRSTAGSALHRPSTGAGSVRLPGAVSVYAAWAGAPL
jgi:hypothetical protein